MKALVMGAPGMIAVEDRNDPVAGPNDALLAVESVGLCGSDIHGFSGETSRRPAGMIMGHEMGATVISCAAEPGLAGQVVTVFPILGCGHCAFCEGDEPNLCPSGQVIGVTPSLQGALAERLAVPRTNVVSMGNASTEHAALVEPLAVGIHAAELGKLSGISVLVIGAGAIGLMCAIAARRFGASHVYVVDRSASRLSRAGELGAEVPDRPDEDAAAWVAARNGGPVETVIDAVGSKASIETALRCMNRGGRAVIVGLGQQHASFDLFDLVVGERSLIGSYCYRRQDFELAASWVRNGMVELDGFVSRTVALSEAQIALSGLADGSDMSTRILISPSRADIANTPDNEAVVRMSAGL